MLQMSRKGFHELLSSEYAWGIIPSLYDLYSGVHEKHVFKKKNAFSAAQIYLLGLVKS